MPSLPTVVVLEPEHFSRRARAVLSENCHVVDYAGGAIPDASIAIVGLKYRIDSSFLSQFPKLKTLATVTTGSNHVDRRALDSRAIELITLHELRDQIMDVRSTAELAVALLLNVWRSVSGGMRGVVEEGRWSRDGLLSSELRGKRLGILGFGRVGTQVADLMQGFGLVVSAFDLDHPVPSSMRKSTVGELLSDIDILSIHADFRGEVIFGSREIELCPKNIVVINTARGELVDEEAVASAIVTGALGGYGADVLAGENRLGWDPKDDPLVGLARSGRNVVLTPHLGGYTKEGFETTQMVMASHLAHKTNPARLR